MTKTIAIGILGLALCSNGAAAQTAVEQAQILREFGQSVDSYARQQSLLFPGTCNAAVDAPKIFTLPVAMVFRQVIARTIAPHDGSAMSGVRSAHRATVDQTVPAAELSAFPKTLSEALPSLPAPLEYRFIENDLVIRDANADVIVAVLRDAIGAIPTK
jgi:hypothetical protein